MELYWRLGWAVSGSILQETIGTDACRKDTSDLKRFGERLQGRGGQSSKAKARIAVARKLSVLLHRLLVTGEVYEPLRNSKSLAA